mgnify:CR=1 FL=1
MRIKILCVVALLLTACGGGGGVSNGPPPPSSDATVSEVQGTGATSPLAGQAVIVSGVVTGDFQEDDDDRRRNLRGFYIQGIPDGNPASSDGVFIFDGSNPAVDVSVGHDDDAVVAQLVGVELVAADAATPAFSSGGAGGS